MSYCRHPRFSLVVSTLGLFAVGVPALGQVQLSKSTKSAHDVFLEGYARVDNKCESIDPPGVTVDEPPEHGIGCSRHADVWMRNIVENNLPQCLHRKALGIHVIYLPRKGYIGPDKVRYTVQFPTVQHTVEVNLTVLPGEPQSHTVVPADISAPLAEKCVGITVSPDCERLTGSDRDHTDLNAACCRENR